MPKTVTISGLVISEEDDQYLQMIKLRMKSDQLMEGNDKRDALKAIIQVVREHDLITASRLKSTLKKKK